MVFILAPMSVFIIIKDSQAGKWLFNLLPRESGERERLEGVLFNYALIVVFNIFLIKMNMLHVEPPLLQDSSPSPLTEIEPTEISH